MHDARAGALDSGRRDLLALVGGGKTTALCRLARESAAAGGRVVVTTTAAMFLSELATLRPVMMEATRPALAAALKEVLSDGRLVAAARAPGEEGKVVGLPGEWVDELWQAGFIDYLVVEADGSRGRGPVRPSDGERYQGADDL